MAKWEFKVCAVQGDSPAHVEETVNASLKQLSEEGWRFVETIYAQQSLPLLLFKKQAKANTKLGGEKQSAGKLPQ